MRNEVPSRWQKALERHDIEPHARGLSRKIGGKPPVHASTIMDFFRNSAQTKPATLLRIRAALPLMTDREWEQLTGRPIFKMEEPPVEFEMLTPRQQKAILSVMRSMLQPVEQQARFPRAARNPPTPKQGDRGT